MFDNSQLSGLFPQYKGGSIQACLAIIADEEPDATALVLHPGEGATLEYNTLRVIIHVNENNIVANIPNRG